MLTEIGYIIKRIKKHDGKIILPHRVSQFQLYQ